MARKKKEIDMFEPEQEDSVGVRLTAEQYWKWRNKITEMWLSEQKLKTCEETLKLKSKEVEVLQAKMQLYIEASVKVRKSEVDEAKSDYLDLKKELESKLGISLDGTSISDETFEVKVLLEEKTASASV
jgi:hypothetical protein